MNLPQVRGLFFELIIREMLRKSGYSSVQEGLVRGRGEEHQIDVFGKFSFNVPFVFPIRLLSEAKWYKRNVRLPELRNFVGVVKDISENYFVNPRTDDNDLQGLLEKRYTDCGTIFSATSFSIKAQRYAYAQGIYLIPFSKNTLLKDILDTSERLIDENIGRFGPDNYEVFEETGTKKTYERIAGEILDNNRKIKEKLERVGSYVGLLDGIYPINILTSDKLNFEPSQPDEQNIISEKEFVQIDATSVHFKFNYGGSIYFEFTFPNRIGKELLAAYKKYPSTPFSYIDIPIQIKDNNNRTYRRIYNMRISLEDKEKIMQYLKEYIKGYIWEINEDSEH